MDRVCDVDGCGGTHKAKGLCARHYRAHLKDSGKLATTRPSSPERNAEQTLRRGNPLGPPRTLPYRALARTCRGCGDLLTTPQDLLRRDSGALPPCPACRVDKVTRSHRKRLARDEDYRERERARTERGRRRVQSALSNKAKNNRKQWTGPELELASREDLSASQVASKLGRTLYAVKHMRRKLRVDPRKVLLAGVSESRTGA